MAAAQRFLIAHGNDIVYDRYALSSEDRRRYFPQQPNSGATYATTQFQPKDEEGGPYLWVGWVSDVHLLPSTIGNGGNIGAISLDSRTILNARRILSNAMPLSLIERILADVDLTDPDTSLNEATRRVV